MVKAARLLVEFFGTVMVSVGIMGELMLTVQSLAVELIH